MYLTDLNVRISEAVTTLMSGMVGGDLVPAHVLADVVSVICAEVDADNERQKALIFAGQSTAAAAINFQRTLNGETALDFSLPSYNPKGVFAIPRYGKNISDEYLRSLIAGYEYARIAWGKTLKPKAVNVPMAGTDAIKYQWFMDYNEPSPLTVETEVWVCHEHMRVGVAQAVMLFNSELLAETVVSHRAEMLAVMREDVPEVGYQALKRLVEGYTIDPLEFEFEYHLSDTRRITMIGVARESSDGDPTITFSSKGHPVPEAFTFPNNRYILLAESEWMRMSRAHRYVVYCAMKRGVDNAITKREQSGDHL